MPGAHNPGQCNITKLVKATEAAKTAEPVRESQLAADNVDTTLLQWPVSVSLMDGWVRVLRPFNSISVISRRWKGEHERLCAMKRRLGSGRISPPVGFEPATPWSEVGSANRSATWTLHQSVGSDVYTQYIYVLLFYSYVVHGITRVHSFIYMYGYSLLQHLSHDMTKPTKWVCAQRRLRSVWASAKSDRSLRCALNG